MWLLQMWLCATFEQEIGFTIPESRKPQIQERTFEGMRTVWLTPNYIENDPKTFFMKYVKVFLNFDSFKPQHAPFSTRDIGPNWYTDVFPPTDPDLDDEVDELWSTYLDPTLLSCRIGSMAKNFGLIGYLPNLVSRQFGFSQIRP